MLAFVTLIDCWYCFQSLCALYYCHCAIVDFAILYLLLVPQDGWMGGTDFAPVVCALLEANADVHAKIESTVNTYCAGLSPLDLAQKHKKSDLVDLIMMYN